MDENEDEDCEDVVDDIVSAKLGLDPYEVDWEGKAKEETDNSKFQMHTVRRKKWKLRSTKKFISEDLPYKTRELIRKILIPAAKRARRIRVPRLQSSEIVW